MPGYDFECRTCHALSEVQQMNEQLKIPFLHGNLQADGFWGQQKS